MFDEIAREVGATGCNNQNYVFVFVTFGMPWWPGKAVPTSSLYGLLRNAGAGKGLQTWMEGPNTAETINYILVGIPSWGFDTGAEKAEGQPNSELKVNFYRSSTKDSYTLAAAPIGSMASSDSEDEF